MGVVARRGRGADGAVVDELVVERVRGGGGGEWAEMGRFEDGVEFGGDDEA